MGEAKRRKKEITDKKLGTKITGMHLENGYKTRQKKRIPAYKFNHPNELTTREMNAIIRRDKGMDKVEVTPESPLDSMVNPEKKVKYNLA